MVCRPSAADFQGIGVYRSDEGWGRGGEELSHAPTSSSRWSPTIPLHRCFPGVVKGFNNKAKVTLGKTCGFRTFRITEVLLYQALGKPRESQLTHRFR